MSSTSAQTPLYARLCRELTRRPAPEAKSRRKNRKGRKKTLDPGDAGTFLSLKIDGRGGGRDPHRLWRSTGTVGGVKIPKHSPVAISGEKDAYGLCRRECIRAVGSPSDSRQRGGVSNQLDSLPSLSFLFCSLPQIFIISIFRTQPTGSDSLHRLQNATIHPPPWSAMSI